MASELTLAGLVAGGGAAGALARYAVSRAASAAGMAAPFATFAVNVAGSLLMGFVVAAMLARGGGSEGVRAGVAIGFLGSFTTFSTYSMDIIALARDRGAGLAAAYAGGSVAAGLFAAFIGLALGAAIFTKAPA